MVTTGDPHVGGLADVGVLEQALWRVPRSARWAVPVAAVAFRGAATSPIDPRLRALVLLRAATRDAAPFWRARAEADAARAGVSPELVTLLETDEWDRAGGLDERERAAIHWGDAVVRRLARRDARAFADLQRLFTEEEIVELTLVASLAACFHRFTNALRLPPPSSPAPVPDGPVTTEALRQWTTIMFDDPPPGPEAPA